MPRRRSKNAVDSTKTESASVAAAADQASRNVETVASAAEELSSSITEISRQVSQANDVSNRAVTEADETSGQIRILEENVTKIGEIVSLINDIAAQTNLLALNATIEAARAGEAGKGFAVVASEVKNLANQTAKATDEISTQIGQVQASTQQAVSAIGSISGVIRDISEISGSISAAVEEQGAATQEIARNVEEASGGTQSVSVSINDVLQSAQKSDATADAISDASNALSTQSDTLQTRVASFLQEVKHDDIDKAEIVSWKPEYDSGNTQIDTEHRRLLEMINGVYRAMKTGGQVGVDAISNMKSEYAKHFSSEHDFMSQRNYAGLESHREEHAAFMKRLTDMEAEFKAGIPPAASTSSACWPIGGASMRTARIGAWPSSPSGGG